MGTYLAIYTLLYGNVNFQPITYYTSTYPVRFILSFISENSDEKYKYKTKYPKSSNIKKIFPLNYDILFLYRTTQNNNMCNNTNTKQYVEL